MARRPRLEPETAALAGLGGPRSRALAVIAPHPVRLGATPRDEPGEVALLKVIDRSASSNLRGKVAVYVAGGSITLVFVAALAVLDAERGAEGANIGSFGDALWWACTSVTTVGYGDQFPSPVLVEQWGVGLMVSGRALLGTVPAALASWLVEAVREETDETNREVVDLRAEIARLATLIEAAQQKPQIPRS